jgi:hypothetical protein
MKRYATTSWARFLAAALLAWLGQGTVAPSAARASCGDYVTVSSGEGETTPSHQPPAPTRPCPGNVTPCREHVPAEALPDSQVPCRGPGCSGNPVPPPEPLTTVSPEGGQDHWVCLVSLPVFLPADPGDPRTEPGALRPVRHGLSVFHPPRPF